MCVQLHEATDKTPPCPLVYDALRHERAERNRIAREAAELRQENERLIELVDRMRPVVEAAIAEDITEEMADQPDAGLNRIIASELADAREERRVAVRLWHDLADDDVAEGRSPLDVRA